ncbi:MAG: hypothetical protein ACYTFE_07860, partial [Planctomycetota bacterium]
TKKSLLSPSHNTYDNRYNPHLSTMPQVMKLFKNMASQMSKFIPLEVLINISRTIDTTKKHKTKNYFSVLYET